MLAPPPRPAGYPRPRYAPGWPFTPEERKKFIALLRKGSRAGETADILRGIQEHIRDYYRAWNKRQDRVPRRQEKLIWDALGAGPGKRGPKSHDRKFVEDVIGELVGHFRIRPGERLETFLIELCKIVEIRRPSIDRAIRETAKYLRS
jgi:hypothetical protein